jgi:hypothetical protein
MSKLVRFFALAAILGIASCTSTYPTAPISQADRDWLQDALSRRDSAVP